MALKLTSKFMGLLTAFLMAVFVVFTPLNPVVSEFLGWSIYPYYLLLLIFLNTALLIYNGKFQNSVLVNPANLLMFCFTVILLYEAESVGSILTIIGAVWLPYVLGALYALRKNDESQFEKYFLILLIFKAGLVLLFFGELIKDYPVRPLFEGRAIYLQFGWALDVAPFLIIYFLYKKQNFTTVHVVSVSMVLFLLAFVIVTMASRTMIILSVLLAIIFSFIYIRDSKVKLFGGVIYPVFVLICLLAFPVKQEHLFNMVSTLTSFVTTNEVAVNLPEDRSSAIRLEGIVSIFSDKDVTSHEHPLDINSGNFFWSGHFWLGQVNYYTGKLGLLIFATLILCFTASLYRLSKRTCDGDGLSNVILTMLSLSYLLHILYVSGILNHPIFFLIIGLLVNLKRGRGKSESFLKSLAPKQLIASDMR